MERIGPAPQGPVASPCFQLFFRVDLSVTDEAVARGLFRTGDFAEFKAVHAYPVQAVYTFNYAGRPTLSAVRGYMAVQAIRGLGAEHQRDPGLLDWMYGKHAEVAA